ncbi:MAG: hypothetical protein NE334_20490 [Lentisphaeraceae bacterium]|nr:hypothetical protein [Lentisphaeraceae bacterium]
MKELTKIVAGLLLSFLFTLTTLAEDAKWTFLGPQKNTPISHATFYQHPKKPNIMLVASRGAKSTKGGENQGMWRSTDAGKTWTLLDSKIGYMINTNDGMNADPNNPDVLYLAQEFTPDFCWSTDAGATWQKKGKAGFKHGIVVQVHPRDSKKLFVGSDDGLWLSKDGGKSWKVQANNGLPPDARGVSNTLNSIEINPQNPDVMYAGFLYADMKTEWGVYKSTDGGKKWSPANNGLPEGQLILDLRTAKTKVKMALPKYGLQYRAIKDLEMDPNNPNTLYAITRQSGIFKTTNGAQDWKLILAPDGPEKKQWSDFSTSITIHPKYSNVLFVGTGGLNVRVSTDAGKTWNALGRMISVKDHGNGLLEATLPNGTVKKGKKSLSPLLGYHYMSSVHKVHVDAKNERKIYVETDQGVFTTTVPDSFSFK